MKVKPFFLVTKGEERIIKNKHAKNPTTLPYTQTQLNRVIKYESSTKVYFKSACEFITFSSDRVEYSGKRKAGIETEIRKVLYSMDI